MRILYIVPFVPWQVRVRSFNLIPRLARRHEIHLICVSSAGPSAEQHEWQRRYCEQAVHVKHSALRGMARCAAALPTMTPLRMAYCQSKSAQQAVLQAYRAAQPDVIYVERWRGLEFVPEGVDAPLVCDPTDSMTLYNQRLMKAGAWWERLLGWEEYRKFLRYEGRLARRANVCVFCSRLDMDCVKEQAPEVRCELVPNGVDCEKLFFKQAGDVEPATLIFTGSFKYRPNCHAVTFFLANIFPLIRKRVPQTKFVAVGNGAGTALASCRRDGVEIVDFVPDLRPYLAKATVVVAPLTVGAGVSNKLGEGFAVGTPVVAVPLACGDLPVTTGRELLIGRSSEEFAEHVVRLLRDPALRKSLAMRARRFVEEKYDWEIVYRKMEDTMLKVADADRFESSERALTSA